MEAFDTEHSKWWYLCFWHYLFYRIKNDKNMGYATVDTDREAIESLKEELWDIEADLYLIKEKLEL
jgi:hypothetical protein